MVEVYACLFACFILRLLSPVYAIVWHHAQVLAAVWILRKPLSYNVGQTEQSNTVSQDVFQTLTVIRCLQNGVVVVFVIVVVGEFPRLRWPWRDLARLKFCAAPAARSFLRTNDLPPMVISRTHVEQAR